ncbi:MAG TPA: FMN-binding protein [Kribbella sp.]|uniref:FMN-binding protein n=1 Tax=Kribbella sp. TaxID=1871183 RepID=UPI002D77A691|nr:FMN-binding protein [Kribbella sp.]HET6296655.1 FMN-binding protein [Kribbella sp.]
MRRPIAVVMSAISIGVIGFSLRASEQTGSSAAQGVVQPGVVQPSASPSAESSAAPDSSTNGTPSASPTPHVSPSARPGKSPAPTTVKVNGAAADTDYGPVQVQLSMRGSKILSATAIAYPQGSNRDQAINSYAIPILQQDTLAKQSANVDTVSGATYTSEGYRQSLQSALDAANQAGSK